MAQIVRHLYIVISRYRARARYRSTQNDMSWKWNDSGCPEHVKLFEFMLPYFRKRRQSWARSLEVLFYRQSLSRWDRNYICGLGQLSVQSGCLRCHCYRKRIFSKGSSDHVIHLKSYFCCTLVNLTIIRSFLRDLNRSSSTNFMIHSYIEICRFLPQLLARFVVLLISSNVEHAREKNRSPYWQRWRR